jgi:hypothetical protein
VANTLMIIRAGTVDFIAWLGVFATSGKRPFKGLASTGLKKIGLT